MNGKFFHAVTLDEDACKGCINCIKRCPTEAIRVRDGKAHILPERCIDCGECIRICPHHAKKATYDPLSMTQNYKYKIALPAPTLYGQFNHLDDVDILLSAIKELGFDAVFEVSKAAELLSAATRKALKSSTQPKPVISSACPAVVRLIRVRFPGLIDHVLKFNSPAEIAARLAKAKAAKETGLDESEIGTFFISPCPAKYTAIKMPLGTEKSSIDGVLAIKDLYPKLLPLMKEATLSDEVLSESGKMGISWAGSGGESAALLNDTYLAADGIENVIRVLEDLEDEKFSDLEFIELNACSGGCVGGVLTVENPYVARTKIKKLRRYMPVSRNDLTQDPPESFLWDKELAFEPVLQLGDTFKEASLNMVKLEEIVAGFPSLDCGACGAPTCRALAEDVVRGYADVGDCVHKLRERVSAAIEVLEPKTGKRTEKQ